MNLMNMSLVEASAAAIAIVAGQTGGSARLVASPELAALSRNDQVKLLIDGAQLLLLAAKGLEARSSKPSA